MLALPCCHRCGCVDCGGKGAEGASATGSEGPSLTSSVAVRGRGGGGAARNMSATDLVAVGCGPYDPEVGTGAAARRGCLGPPRCG